MSFMNRGTATRDRPNFLSMLLFLFLLAFGVISTSTGITAIRKQHFQSQWEQTGGLELGPVLLGNSATHGVDRFDGLEAIRVGIGVMTFGALMALWGLGGIWSLLRPNSLELPPHVGIGLCIFSAFLQTTALMCILPPWRMGSGIAPALWTTMTLIILVIYLSWHLNLASRMRFWNKMLVVLGIVVLCASAALGDRSWLGIVLAVFASLSYAIHAAIVYGFATKQQLLGSV